MPLPALSSRWRPLFLLVASLLAAPLAPTHLGAQGATVSLRTLHTFHDLGDGSFPYGGLLKGDDGNLYGTTFAGGVGADNGGTLFRLAPDGTLTTFVSYPAGQPYSTFAAGLDGNLYGTASAGGKDNAGFVFRLGLDGASTIVGTFDARRTGSNPRSGLVLGADGILYGTTNSGGASNLGTVVRVTYRGEVTLLHSFNTADGDGINPNGTLVQGRDGNFYGTTASGGARGQGTVYKVSPVGAFTTVYSFTGGADGGSPRAGLVLGGDGNFYGTANSGGAHGQGTAFQLTPPGFLTTLHAFGATPADGARPTTPLVDGGDGSFYGTTLGGGPANAGTIFAVTPVGGYTLLYAFVDDLDGAQPSGPLARAGDGVFYGTTGAGGANRGLGTVYRLNLRTPPEVPGTLSFATTLAAVSENAGVVTLTVNREGGTSGAVSVRYTTADGTAVQGVDYLPTSGLLAWRDGDSASRSFQVAISDLGLSDGSTRAFSVRLFSPLGGAALGVNAVAGVSIAENDPPPPPFVPTVTVSVLGNGTVTVGGGGAKVLFSRDGDTASSLTLTYRVASQARNGTDFALLPGTVTIPAGKTGYKLKVKPGRNAQFKGRTPIKIKPAADINGKFQVSPRQVKVQFVNPD